MIVAVTGSVGVNCCLQVSIAYIHIDNVFLLIQTYE